MEKICVITGGTSGIGKCTAEAMRQKGYAVYELSRRETGVAGFVCHGAALDNAGNLQVFIQSHVQTPFL